MTTAFCERCKREHPGKACDYDTATGTCAMSMFPNIDLAGIPVKIMDSLKDGVVVFLEDGPKSEIFSKEMPRPGEDVVAWLSRSRVLTVKRSELIALAVKTIRGEL